MAYARGVVKVCLADPDTTLAQRLGLFRVANAGGADNRAVPVS
jgi:hypothetical protein